MIRSLLFVLVSVWFFSEGLSQGWTQPIPTSGPAFQVQSNPPPLYVTNITRLEAPAFQPYVLVMPTNQFCVKHLKAFVITKVITDTITIDPTMGAQWITVRKVRCPVKWCIRLTETNKIWIESNNVHTAIEQLKKRNTKP